MTKFSKNNLTPYFFINHKKLPKDYIKNCREMLQKLKQKRKENNDHYQSTDLSKTLDTH
jgi:hypothetical protein